MAERERDEARPTADIEARFFGDLPCKVTDTFRDAGNYTKKRLLKAFRSAFSDFYAASEAYLKTNEILQEAIEEKNQAIRSAESRLREREEQLKTYGEHRAYCEIDPGRNCTCGLSEALAAIRKEKP